MLNDDVSRQTFLLVLQLILAKINFYSVLLLLLLLFVSATSGWTVMLPL